MSNGIDQQRDQIIDGDPGIIWNFVKDLAVALFNCFIGKNIVEYLFQVNNIDVPNFSIEIFSTLIVTTSLMIVEIVIYGKKNRSFFNLSTKSLRIICLLLILVAIIAFVFYSIMALLAGFILLNACIALIASIIPSDRSLIRSIMAAVPATNLVAVAILGGGAIFSGTMAENNSTISPIQGFADLAIVNDCEIPIHYGGLGDRIPHVDIEPFGIQTIQIPGNHYDVNRDGSKIIIKCTYIPFPPIAVEKDTRIILDGKEIKPGSEMTLDMIPNSSHRLIIGCRV